MSGVHKSPPPPNIYICIHTYRRHTKIFGAGKVTWSKFSNEGPQILGATVQNSVAHAIWRPRFVYPHIKWALNLYTTYCVLMRTCSIVRNSEFIYTAIRNKNSHTAVWKLHIFSSPKSFFFLFYSYLISNHVLFKIPIQLELSFQAVLVFFCSLNLCNGRSRIIHVGSR
jgi:hypothetical protein